MNPTYLEAPQTTEGPFRSMTLSSAAPGRTPVHYCALNGDAGTLRAFVDLANISSAELCRGPIPPTKSGKIIPIGSMYAIYGNIYHQYTPNVSIYTIHGSYGIGKWTWENHGKSGKSWEDDCRKYMEIWKFSSYPLVNCPITMERSTILNGKTHYFYGHMLNYQRVTVCYGKVSFLRGFLVDNVDISIVNDAHLFINQQTYQQWWFQLSHMMVLT